MDSEAVVYGVDYPARALAVAEGDGEVIRFLIGTQTLNNTNEVHAITFDDDTSVVSSTVLRHPHGEVWSIGSSTSDVNMFATCYQAISGNKVARKAVLLRTPEGLDQSVDSAEVEEVGHLEGGVGDGDAVKVVWSPQSGGCAATVHRRALRTWDLGTMTHNLAYRPKDAGAAQLITMQWNPHDEGATQMAVGEGCSVVGIDTRAGSGAFTFRIPEAHDEFLRDVDYNPNKVYALVSAGDDGAVKFWDVRKPTRPLKAITRHSHWVWAVRYNRFHDQLVLSASSDSQVLLSNVVSISSEPYGHFDDDGADQTDEEDTDIDQEPPADGFKEGSIEGGERTVKQQEDHLVCTYDTHEDSVYAAEWSGVDPWVFASLSYDGRLVINRVPLDEKWKILL